MHVHYPFRFDYNNVTFSPFNYVPNLLCGSYTDDHIAFVLVFLRNVTYTYILYVSCGLSIHGTLWGWMLNSASMCMGFHLAPHYNWFVFDCAIHTILHDSFFSLYLLFNMQIRHFHMRRSRRYLLRLAD